MSNITTHTPTYVQHVPLIVKVLEAEKGPMTTIAIAEKLGMDKTRRSVLGDILWAAIDDRKNGIIHLGKVQVPVPVTKGMVRNTMQNVWGLKEWDLKPFEGQIKRGADRQRYERPGARKQPPPEPRYETRQRRQREEVVNVTVGDHYTCIGVLLDGPDRLLFTFDDGKGKRFVAQYVEGK